MDKLWPEKISKPTIPSQEKKTQPVTETGDKDLNKQKEGERKPSFKDILKKEIKKQQNDQ